jgi:DNA repair exonuclease SbcCD ATPase subunit
MEPEPAVIRWVSIENFRGFRAERTIDLAASATIVSGSNGKGKTSFFDALQWLLLGSLGRLASLASRRSGEYIVNRFAGASATARVSAQLQLDGREVTVTRTGDHKTTVLQWLDGGQSLTDDEAERALHEALLSDPEMSLKDMVLNSGLLQQDVVRAVLEDEPKNRYRHMAALLGLEEIAGFEGEAKRRAEEQDKVAKRARDAHAEAEQQLRSVEGDLVRLEARLSTQPVIAGARARLESKLAGSNTSFEISELPMQATDAISLGQMARRVRATADDLVLEDAKLREQEGNLPDVHSEELVEMQSSEEKAKHELAEAQHAVDEALARQRDAERRASQLGELATHAMPLLGEHCPVCQQKIDVADVEKHLRELIDTGGENLPALVANTAEAQQQLSKVDLALRELEAKRLQLQTAVNQVAAARVTREHWQRGCEQLASSEIRLRPDERRAISAGELSGLARLRASAEQLAAIADELASLLGTSGLAEEAERLREQANTLRQAVTELSEHAAQSSRLAGDAKTVSVAATQAITGVTRDRFARLQPLVDDIFARLAPHPAFTALGFEMGVSYRSGVADPFVKDPESGVTGDPLLIFSSSQANVAALTYFLALSWAADTKALPFLLLDDPLQSMDDVNALGFSDLCRHIRQRRQLVVSTHEQRLASLLERKLTPRFPHTRTRLVRFTGWDRDGPTIEQLDVEPESVGYLLRAG